MDRCERYWAVRVSAAVTVSPPSGRRGGDPGIGWRRAGAAADLFRHCAEGPPSPLAPVDKHGPITQYALSAGATTLFVGMG